MFFSVLVKSKVDQINKDAVMPPSYLQSGPHAKMFGAFFLLAVKTPSPKDFLLLMSDTSMQ